MQVKDLLSITGFIGNFLQRFYQKPPSNTNVAYQGSSLFKYFFIVIKANVFFVTKQLSLDAFIVNQHFFFM